MKGRCQLERIFRYNRRPGYQSLAGPGQAGLQRLGLGMLRLRRDQEYSSSLDEREAVLVLLSGRCTVQVDGDSWLLERVSVFAERPVAVYVPRHRHYSVMASKPADLAVFSTVAVNDFLPRYIRPEAIEEHVEGAAGFRRRVYTIVAPEFPADRLLVGETHAEQGDWAAYPPHKHDEDRYPGEVRLEEVALFQVDPPQGFGLQYVYTLDGRINEVYPVHNDEAVAVAEGFHPVAAAPGYSLCYLWGMAGDGRVVRSSPDPAHAWVAQETGAPQPVAVPS